MRHRLLPPVIGALFVCVSSFQAIAAGDRFVPAATLEPFASDAQLQAYFEPLAAQRERVETARRLEEQERLLREAQVRRRWEAANPGKTWRPPAPVFAPVPAPAAPAAQATTGATASKASAAESVTNDQVAGVDEGGIVKVHGRHLVVLRRGRLFTVDVDRGQLAVVDRVDAFGPDVDPSGAWYDEMLIAGDTVAVLGYSYARGGTELALFDIDAAGRLTYRATHHLRSTDYYSSRNYASRLVGTTLVLYAPIDIGYRDVDPMARLPAVRRWSRQTPPAFQRMSHATRIYRTDDALDPAAGVTLHAIVRCDLARPALACESTGVLGPRGRVFHVSSRAVYVWTVDYPGGSRMGQQKGREPARASVFRLPLDGRAPSILRAQGSPIDQFSFYEGDDGYLNVLVQSNGQGDAMWRAERDGGNLALMRVPVRAFGGSRAEAPAGAYARLPSAPASARHSAWHMHNRFVGGRLLYGGKSGGMVGGMSRPSGDGAGWIAVTRFAEAGAPTRMIALDHAAERIDALGSDAIVIGAAGPDLVFSSLRLGPGAPLAGRYVLPDAAQSESRSHGFFYKPEAPARGVVGLPVFNGGSAGQPAAPHTASMLYLRSDRLALREIGSLNAWPGVGANDGCRASCTDWYGNARPIFLRGRVFALMGYEIVEGHVLRDGGQERLIETRRVDLAAGLGHAPS